MSPCDSQPGDPVDDINRQIETIDLVANGEFQRCIDITVFLVAAHVQVLVVGTPISEFVDQPGVAMKIDALRYRSCSGHTS